MQAWLNPRCREYAPMLRKRGRIVGEVILDAFMPGSCNGEETEQQRHSGDEEEEPQQRQGGGSTGGKGANAAAAAGGAARARRRARKQICYADAVSRSLQDTLADRLPVREVVDVLDPLITVSVVGCSDAAEPCSTHPLEQQGGTLDPGHATAAQAPGMVAALVPRPMKPVAPLLQPVITPFVDGLKEPIYAKVNRKRRRLCHASLRPVTCGTLFLPSLAPPQVDEVEQLVKTSFVAVAAGCLAAGYLAGRFGPLSGARRRGN